MQEIAHVSLGEALAKGPPPPGSFLFVAAGQTHRFEDVSSAFACWVFFYGPDGGEQAP